MRLRLCNVENNYFRALLNLLPAIGHIVEILRVDYKKTFKRLHKLSAPNSNCDAIASFSFIANLQYKLCRILKIVIENFSYTKAISTGDYWAVLCGDSRTLSGVNSESRRRNSGFCSNVSGAEGDADRGFAEGGIRCSDVWRW
jgi:hypothetical protein